MHCIRIKRRDYDTSTAVEKNIRQTLTSFNDKRVKLVIETYST